MGVSGLMLTGLLSTYYSECTLLAGPLSFVKPSMVGLKTVLLPHNNFTGQRAQLRPKLAQPTLKSALSAG